MWQVYQMRRHSFWKQEAETRIAKQLDYLHTKGLWAGETVIVSSKDEEQEREREKEKQRDIRGTSQVAERGLWLLARRACKVLAKFLGILEPRALEGEVDSCISE
ncbi:unnamed protein product [Symbiodinium necroappetens]|uniref:Uncharacterized protein n=1 Tax=Symbiodinium necroappetens TaxID=1628268 RepID=A0A812PPY7_9DINO|nr:unnamed protein product [Symbiodinium necroappetens]